jgi:hypothetical protein
MKGLGLLASLLAISYGYGSETVFSVNDDVLAYPQVWQKQTITCPQLTLSSMRLYSQNLTYSMKKPTRD